MESYSGAIGHTYSVYAPREAPYYPNTAPLPWELTWEEKMQDANLAPLPGTYPKHRGVQPYNPSNIPGGPNPLMSDTIRPPIQGRGLTTRLLNRFSARRP